MLYTHTDCFFLQFFVKDLLNESKSRCAVLNAFDFSHVSDHHLTKHHSIANAGEVGYFTYECKFLSDRRVCQTLAKNELVYCNGN